MLPVSESIALVSLEHCFGLSNSMLSHEKSMAPRDAEPCFCFYGCEAINKRFLVVETLRVPVDLVDEAFLAVVVVVVCTGGL